MDSNKFGEGKLLPKKMKNWFGGALVISLLFLLILRYGFIENDIIGSPVSSPKISNTSDVLEWLQGAPTSGIRMPELSDRVVSTDVLVSSLFRRTNFSAELQDSLQTWNYMKNLIDYTQNMPNAVEAIKEAVFAWETLVNSTENQESFGVGKEKQCPNFLNKMNATEFGKKGYRVKIPCGLIQGSSISIIGIPKGILGNFQIDLIGESLPGEQNPPVVLHYNVRLSGDKLTDEPVIVQNTWRVSTGWNAEERCPSVDSGNSKKVDELKQCNQRMGKDENEKLSNSSIWSSMVRNKSKPKKYFPFKQEYLSVMTLRAGEEGVHVTVDGRHATSFAYRESLEPWLVSEVRISGDLELISVMVSGLPTSTDLNDNVELEALKSVPLGIHKPLDLFIGVFSTANNFKRRMSVRRTWMQYPAVKNGKVAVRFFVGLHKNQMVNEELWNEVKTYGDIQLMPFIDYYTLITWKTMAICTFGTQVVSAKFIMKTDDDSFVRVDEVIASLKQSKVKNGFLYGLINSDAKPHRDPNSKWYINPKEWEEETYPPWAHGPGYVVSKDIATLIHKKYESGQLKMFKLEDVAMGVWIANLKKDGLKVSYVNEPRVYNEGCKNNYVVAHYQNPRHMLCLWKILQEDKEAKCCTL
jgi:beta-1,3-galactosyltransferase